MRWRAPNATALPTAAASAAMFHFLWRNCTLSLALFFVQPNFENIIYNTNIKNTVIVLLSLSILNKSWLFLHENQTDIDPSPAQSHPINTQTKRRTQKIKPPTFNNTSKSMMPFPHPFCFFGNIIKIKIKIIAKYYYYWDICETH